MPYLHIVVSVGSIHCIEEWQCGRVKKEGYAPNLLALLTGYVADSCYAGAKISRYNSWHSVAQRSAEEDLSYYSFFSVGLHHLRNFSSAQILKHFLVHHPAARSWIGIHHAEHRDRPSKTWWITDRMEDDHTCNDLMKHIYFSNVCAYVFMYVNPNRMI